MKETHLSLKDYVDFQKIAANVRAVSIKLYQLNYLIGQEDMAAAVESIWEENPKAFSVLDLLIAARTKDNAITDCFKSPEQITAFLNETGLTEVFKSKRIKNLVDYVFGIEVGLSSNARKNRGSRRQNQPPRYTPENISHLEPGEIFVFGSNLQGMHGGGAARVAFSRFGAVWGLGVGPQGQTYAIPTMHGGVETIKPYVDQFADYARQCHRNTFYVTRIGCGIAGFTDEEIAPLFDEAYNLDNVRLPKSFADIIERNRKA